MTIETLTIAGAFDDDDELFTRPPRSLARQQATTARRSCRACQGSYVVPLSYDGPPLCEGCRADVGATRARVRDWLNGVIDQENAALDVWDAAREAHQAHWEKIQDARDLPDYAARCAKHRAAGGVYGQLLDAEATYVQALERLGVERQHLEWALEAIDEHAWLSSPVEQSEPRDLFGARPNEYELPHDARIVECQSCGAGMVFVKTPAGKALPLSAATIQTRDGARYALPHFADCPQSREWSGRGKRQ